MVRETVPSQQQQHRTTSNRIKTTASTPALVMCKSGRAHHHSSRRVSEHPYGRKFEIPVQRSHRSAACPMAKERLVQNKRVSRSSIQENIRLPVSLRPHQIARELGAIQSIAICKSTAPQWRFRAIWPKWSHTIPNFFFPALPGEYETLSVNYWNFDVKES